MSTQTERTEKKDTRFFEALADGLTVTAALKLAGYTRTWAYKQKREDEEFATLWANADDIAVEAMEAELDRRAFKGVDEPIFYQGENVATVKKYSDILLMFRLKAKRPETYRENVRTEHVGKDGGPIIIAETEVVKDYGQPSQVTPDEIPPSD